MEKIKLRAKDFAIFDMCLMELRELIRFGNNCTEVLDAFGALQRLMPLFELDRSEIPGAEL